MNRDSKTIAKYSSLVALLAILVLLVSFNTTAQNTDSPSLTLNQTQTALVAEGNEGWVDKLLQLTLSPFATLWGWLKQDDNSGGEQYLTLPSEFETESVTAETIIASIVVNTNPEGRVTCQPNEVPYEFFVLLKDGASYLEGNCGQGGEPLNYAFEISVWLKNNHAYPSVSRDTLKTVPLFFGDGAQALAGVGGNN